MRAAWGPDPVSFDGRFFKIAESRLNPKPVQDGGPPIVVGAVAPVSIKRAARLGLGFNPVLMSWEALEEAVTTFREAESDPGSLPVVVRVNNSLKGLPVDDRPPLGGSADQVAEDLHRLRALEVDEVFWSMDYDPVPPDAQLERMTELLKII
jgi:alkanesulfonate monooxygenase SsuD/methylene tetrahydromethanopterin reductase-like flavin-dependent oxidoreductase (luciferase family)